MIKVKILVSFLILALIVSATDTDVKTKTTTADATDKSDDKTNSTVDAKETKEKTTKGSGKLPTSLGKTDEEPKAIEVDKKKKEEDANKPKISFNFLDAPLADISWCGTDKETMFLLTEKGSLYRTTDAGESWNLLNDHLIKEGLKEVESKKKVDS